MARTALDEQTEPGSRPKRGAIWVGIEGIPDRDTLGFVVVDSRELDDPRVDPKFKFVGPQSTAIVDPIFRSATDLKRWAVKMLSSEAAQLYAPHVYCKGLRLLKGNPGKGEAYSQMMAIVVQNQPPGKFGAAAPESERSALKDRKAIKRGAVSLQPFGKEGWTFDSHRMSIRMALEFAALVLRDVLMRELDDRYYLEWLVVLGPKAWINDALDIALPKNVAPQDVEKSLTALAQRRQPDSPRSPVAPAPAVKPHAEPSADSALAFTVSQLLDLMQKHTAAPKPWSELLAVIRPGLDMLLGKLTAAGIKAEGVTISDQQRAQLLEVILRQAEAEIFAPREQTLAAHAARVEQQERAHAEGISRDRAAIESERASLAEERAALARERQALDKVRQEVEEFDRSITAELDSREAALKAREAAVAQAEATVQANLKFVEFGKHAASFAAGLSPGEIPLPPTAAEPLPATAAVSKPPAPAAAAPATPSPTQLPSSSTQAPNGHHGGSAKQSPPPDDRRNRLGGWRATVIGGEPAKAG